MFPLALAQVPQVPLLTCACAQKSHPIYFEA